jgi:hypothetical protein
MSERDQFAASALTGLLAHPTHDHVDQRRLMHINASMYARIAYELADAMMDERAKKTDNTDENQ